MSRLEELYQRIQDEQKKTGTSQYDEDIATTRILVSSLNNDGLVYFIAALGYECLLLEAKCIAHADTVTYMKDKLLEIRNAIDCVM